MPVPLLPEKLRRAWEPLSRGVQREGQMEGVVRWEREGGKHEGENRLVVRYE